MHVLLWHGLRRRLTVARLFPCTWWLTTPAFAGARTSPSPRQDLAVAGLLAPAAMFLDLVTLPLRLPLLLIWPGHRPG